MYRVFPNFWSGIQFFSLSYPTGEFFLYIIVIYNYLLSTTTRTETNQTKLVLSSETDFIQGTIISLMWIQWLSDPHPHEPVQKACINEPFEK